VEGFKISIIEELIKTDGKDHGLNEDEVIPDDNALGAETPFLSKFPIRILPEK
jgi:hypothetical protein